MGVVQKVFGTHSEREIRRIEGLVKKIEDMRPAMMDLTDEQLRDKTKEYKKRLADGATLDDLLPEAYATVREAARRILNTEHYRVQLIGGIILHQGRIAEMRTGEGKTQTCLLPAYLNALEGKGVHVVTVNDYLAKRDAEWMGQVHEFLGLKVGVVLNDMKSDERREAYNCDITYVTNNELGFDYLRDNMVIYKEQLVLRDLHYAIIDEVDSVLIDEARTPLIISGQSGKSTKLYEACDILARQLTRGEDMEELSKIDAIMGVEREETGDFIVNEKDKVVNLTAQGVAKVERFFQIENLADPENLEIQHNIILALRAHNLMFRDQDYVVKDDQVLIVDEFTGRIMPGRRYSDGLHQAIEAKEHVKVKRESKTLATITFQNFFNKFEKKAGMTGTALTEEKEFRNTYGMDAIEIPTNKPVARQDLNDVVYKTKKEKFNAVVEDVAEAYEKGQPVLVGTVSIEKNELLSKLLAREGIKHNLLNAKNHEKEAEIVAQAGKLGAVTVATNMAGRGTDIMLGGNAEFMAKAQLRRQGMSDLSFVFSAKSFSQAWRRLRYLREIAKSSTRQAKKIKEATARLEEARQRLDALKAVHATALARLNSTQAKMATEQKDADKLVADLRTQGKSLTRELERRREQARKLAAELDRVIEQEAREAEERARREAEERRRREEAEAAARKKAEEEAARKKAEEERKAREAEEAERKAREERQQQTAKPKPAESPKPATPKPAPKPKSEPKETKKETKKETPKPAQKETPNQPAVPAAKPAMEAAPAKKLSGSFAQNKGRLMFPVAGRYVITSNFGTNDHPELSKVKIDNLGIDIEVAKGSSARAVFDGVVSSIFRLDGYHNIIIVRHGEYLTVYAGIERLSVKKGDKVTAGQTLGTIYSDPDDDNRTSLHFEIRHEKQKLNPTEWVK